MFVVLVSGGSLLAQNQYDSAVKMCGNLDFSSSVNSCLAKIKGGYFEAAPLAICKSLSFTSQKMDCLSRIKDKRYPHTSEVNICQGKSFSSSQLDCLDSITSEPAYRRRATTAYQGSSSRTIASTSGSSATARSICDGIIRRQIKFDCYNTIENSWFDLNALPSCSLSSNEAIKVSCLGLIKNKQFSDHQQLKRCQRPPYGDNMIECFSRSKYKVRTIYSAPEQSSDFIEAIKHTQKALNHMYNKKAGKAKKQLQKAMGEL